MDNPSIVDVAKRAGVSITTVSRIINNTSYPVAAKTREKVLKAIEELHYSPNKIAQRLKKSTSDIVGLIVRDVCDPYFAEIARGVTDRASQVGYLCFLCNTGRNLENEFRYHDLLWQHRVKGIILAGGGLDQPDYKQILQKQLERHEKYGLKIIALAPQGLEMPYVMINDYEAGKKITEYLIERGHRKIGFIGGPEKVFTSKERLKSYKDAMDAIGMKCEEYIIHCDFSRKGGYEACNLLLSKVQDLTAICCVNDNIAIGAISAIKEHGYKIPEDISIISIGNITEAKYTDPPLTTLSIPHYEMGQLAIDVIAEGKTDVRIILNTRIIERKSVDFSQKTR
ncbi:LacI family transcriptional regulator [Moorella thermoacetica]|uniref:Transcriptional regulator, LacI family n=1 Tax=Moorella thermoacetica (strain ATCC 39073 / JCM 9320) TaxID=264732 RepID=Q2RKT1_MOOTA|nr:LacI family DNA-binding transcriptional regulator [Moorella thermoacetica]AKX93384.1 HTH-type transcriptional repressor PurR [Moorella thermoacetica]AKX96026.1 HTH-type transcriptional repressor PurR [Moorella thermoacetica]OIQ56112.1 HTH-type transcriptional repressor PurR [Moorella thermoacetica]QCZ99836.1 HTH-type transcriptional repressor PurR [Moorella thermoacetica]TYL08294.1 HTH-type transcriptional repressor PurR [Moorella thermoacetica]